MRQIANLLTLVTGSGGSNPPRRVRAYMMTTYKYKLDFVTNGSYLWEDLLLKGLNVGREYYSHSENKVSFKNPFERPIDKLWVKLVCGSERILVWINKHPLGTNPRKSQADACGRQQELSEGDKLWSGTEEYKSGDRDS